MSFERVCDAKAALAAAALLVTVAATTGCATKKYVAAEVAAAESRTEARLEERIDGVSSQVEANQAAIEEQQARIEELSETAREALDRAIAAGKLAEGKFVFEEVLSDERVRFAFDEAELSPAAESALADLAARLAEESANVYLEVQGHTDAVGREEYNLRLGERRAESVRRHLNAEHGVPLHRMSTISYGESSPVASNDTEEGRARNRRVVVVVLK